MSIRITMGKNPKIRLKVVKAAAMLLLLSVVLAATAVVYATTKGRIIWFHAVSSALLTDDGNATQGSVHESSDHNATLITLERNGGPESYWIQMSEGRPGYVLDCLGRKGEFPVFFVSTLLPPCAVNQETELQRNGNDPSKRRLVRQLRRLEFLADDGSRITASW